MKCFSERYGYTKPSNVIIREKITPEIKNAILSCYDRLPSTGINQSENVQKEMERFLWTKFLNLREGDFEVRTGYIITSTPFIGDNTHIWYEKLNLIELSIQFLRGFCKKYGPYFRSVDLFVQQLNQEFERLNFAYRIVDDKIVEITSKAEINHENQT